MPSLEQRICELEKNQFHSIAKDGGGWKAVNGSKVKKMQKWKRQVVELISLKDAEIGDRGEC